MTCLMVRVMESGKLQLEIQTFSLKAIIGDTIQLIQTQASKKELRVVELCDESYLNFCAETNIAFDKSY